MGSKTISIKDGTYRRLDRRKGPDESFSDVIDRLLAHDEGERPLAGLIGTIDDDEHRRLRARSQTFRSEMDERFGVTPDDS